MQLTTDQQETILYLLGYNPSSTTNDITNTISSSYFNVVIDKLVKYITELEDIDFKLDKARLDSMVTEMDDIALSYTQHISHLQMEGSRLLKDVSNLTGVPLLFDRYLGKKTNNLSSSGSNLNNNSNFFYAYY